MSLLKNGKNILSEIEVTNITKFGFCIIVYGKEYFITFDEYSKFKKATIDEILQFKTLAPNQLYWEQLDIDIELDSLVNPQNFPLIYEYN